MDMLRRLINCHIIIVSIIIGRSGGDESTVVKTTMSSEKSSTGDSGEERVVIKTTKVIEKASTTGSACLLV